jgi:creatinine amidohydrolase
MGGNSERNLVEHLNWYEVRSRIENGAATILPIGAAARQHGFDLAMNTDRVQAEWLAARLAGDIDALIWPTVTYGHYPAFVEYAGGALFVLDTGISMLELIDRVLARLDSGNALHLKIHQGPRYRRAAKELVERRHGSHADVLETSLMLALAPDLVDMSRAEVSPAVKVETPGRLTPTDKSSPNYSRSGSYGYPILASSAKADVLLAAMIDDLAEQVTAFVAERNQSAGLKHRSAST